MSVCAPMPHEEIGGMGALALADRGYRADASSMFSVM